MKCFVRTPIISTEVESSYDEIICQKVNPNVISINITSDASFALREVEVYADFSSNKTSWSSWSNWSACKQECVRDTKSSFARGTQSRRRNCLNYKHQDRLETLQLNFQFVKFFRWIFFCCTVSRQYNVYFGARELFYLSYK